MQRKGLFITFEGLEGAGKTTQARLLFNALDLAGFPVLMSREPGGTPIGEAVRAILIDPKFKEMDPLTEALLFSAARRQNVREVILPHLEDGGIVICDRFYDATTAYQGFGNQVPIGDIEDLNSMCAWGATPDVTIYLDIDLDRGLRRVRERYAQNGGALDRLERLGRDFFERVAEGYHHAIENGGERFVIVDGEGDPDEVAAKVLRVLMPRLQRLYPIASKNLNDMSWDLDDEE